MWDPYNQTDIQKLEMVQRRGAGCVNSKHSNLSSVEKMIKELKWRPLEDRRRDARLALFYKIENNLMAIEKEGRLIPPSRKRRYPHEKSYQIPTTTQDYGKSSFPRTIRNVVQVNRGIQSLVDFQELKFLTLVFIRFLKF